MTLRTTRIRTLEQVQDFLDGTDKTDIEISQRTAAYDFIRRTLVEFEYHLRLSKPEKGLIKRYIQKVTGLSRNVWIWAPNVRGSAVLPSNTSTATGRPSRSHSKAKTI